LPLGPGMQGCTPDTVRSRLTPIGLKSNPNRPCPLGSGREPKRHQIKTDPSTPLLGPGLVAGLPREHRVGTGGLAHRQHRLFLVLQRQQRRADRQGSGWKGAQFAVPHQERGEGWGERQSPWPNPTNRKYLATCLTPSLPASLPVNGQLATRAAKYTFTRLTPIYLIRPLGHHLSECVEMLSACARPSFAGKGIEPLQEPA